MRPRYEVLVRFDVDVTAMRLPERFKDVSIQQIGRADYDSIKALVAPSKTDEEFWPKDMAYVIDRRDRTNFTKVKAVGE